MNGGDASETKKDSAIKLFGKTIPVPESHIPVNSEENSDVGCQIPSKSEVQVKIYLYIHVFHILYLFFGKFRTQVIICLAAEKLLENWNTKEKPQPPGS